MRCFFGAKKFEFSKIYGVSARTGVSQCGQGWASSDRGEPVRTGVSQCGQGRASADRGEPVRTGMSQCGQGWASADRDEPVRTGGSIFHDFMRKSFMDVLLFFNYFTWLEKLLL